MTEDEAFIRTIVDRPGDDLPRLVYADWLDERNDPRGAYLRAELELVRNDDAGGLETLCRSLVTIADFDLVWAARVSRPPAGVCCDHLQFSNCGPLVSLDEIHHFERRTRFGLPDAYRAFLLNYNAGQVIPTITSPKPADQFEGNPVLCFSPLGHSYSIPHERISRLRDHTSYTELGFALIGYDASSLTNLLIGITTANDGELFIDDTIRPDTAFGGRPRWIEGNLPAFLSGLSPRWERVRTGRYDI